MPPFENIVGPENPRGNVEYKLKLIHPNDDRLVELATQLNYRLNEGDGEAFYELGVSDEGEPVGLPDWELTNSLHVLEQIAEHVGAKMSLIRTGKAKHGKLAEVLLRRLKEEGFPIDITIVSIGNVDSGKSTLIGVLLGGELDNGNGSARTRVFRHKHELLSGRTSSVAVRTLGFDEMGALVNHSLIPPSHAEILERSAKIISIVDLAGHERYLKTTVFGLTGHEPDYAMLAVAANAGVQPMTREHLGIAFALKLPIFVVLTKVDIAPNSIFQTTKHEVVRVIKMPGVARIPFFVKDTDDVAVSAKNIGRTTRIVPIFKVSNVTGKGIDLLTQFLNLIPAYKRWESQVDHPFLAYIDELFLVPGIGTVVAATINQGVYSLGSPLKLGPDVNGDFYDVKVKSMHYKRVFVNTVTAGQEATFALRGVDRDEVRKGMVLLDPNYTMTVTREFVADTMVLYHATTIRQGYEAMVHCRTIRQQAKITRILKADHPALRTGDRARVIFRFLFQPEFLLEGDRFVFREGRTRGIGVIRSILSTSHEAMADEIA
ncbi:MAG: GTP-binding protein [Candidatus Heimdallarchaeota archaeon]